MFVTVSINKYFPFLPFFLDDKHQKHRKGRSPGISFLVQAETSQNWPCLNVLFIFFPILYLKRLAVVGPLSCLPVEEGYYSFSDSCESCPIEILTRTVS